MLRDPLGFLESTVHLGSLVGLRLGSEAVVLVSDQSAARKIMIEQPSFFAKVRSPPARLKVVQGYVHPAHCK